VTARRCRSADHLYAEHDAGLCRVYASNFAELLPAAESVRWFSPCSRTLNPLYTKEKTSEAKV